MEARKVSFAPVSGRRALFLAGAGALLLSACVPWGGADLPKTVTRRSIRAITLGMTQGDVSDLLGPAVNVENPGKLCDRDGHCAVDRAVGWETWAYSRKVEGVRWFPMLWVNFEAGKVRSVYASRNTFYGDKDGVYMTSIEGTWSKPEFESTFPP